MGDNINFDTDIFTRNESQDYVDGVVDVDDFVVTLLFVTTLT